MISRFAWSEPHTVREALDQLGPDALVKAGGVDVIDRLKEGLDAPQKLVNIRNLKELDFVREDAAGLHIGPLATLTRIEEDKTIQKKYRALADACGHAATPHIRNQATVGGNLLQRPRCWYFRSSQFHCLKKGGGRCFAQFGENEYHAVFHNRTCAIVHPSAAAVALVALDARLEITGKNGNKRDLLLEKFFVSPEEDVHRENVLGANELITAIHVPAPAAMARSAYMKIGEKESFDWPIAEVAVSVELAGGKVSKASVILGAASPIPHRAVEAESVLKGKPFTQENARAAAVAAMKHATPLGNNAYKLPVFEAVIRRTLMAAAG